MRTKFFGAALAAFLTVASTLFVGAPASAVQPGRIAGANRFATSASLAGAFAPGVSTVYIASGLNYPDALAGGAAAAASNSPVLLVGRNDIPYQIRSELQRLAPQRIIVLGGTSAVSAAVVSELGQYTGSVEVLAGTDRYDTAAKLSSATFGRGVPVAYVASGNNFADALGSGAAAGYQGGPVLLTSPYGLSSSVVAELQRLAPQRIVVLGGTAAVNDGVLAQLQAFGPTQRIGGADRYETAAAVSRATFSQASTVYLAFGGNFPDALSGAPRAATESAPVLLVNSNGVSPAVCAEVTRLGATQVVALGGPATIPDWVINHVAAGCPAPPPPAPTTAGAELSSYQAQMLGKVNADRAAAGLAPVAPMAALNATAQQWSETQAREGRMYHNPAISSQIPSSWSYWGENVLKAYRLDMGYFEQLWMDSPGHRANILNPSFTHMGFGYAKGANDAIYATQLFAQY